MGQGSAIDGVVWVAGGVTGSVFFMAFEVELEVGWDRDAALFNAISSSLWCWSFFISNRTKVEEEEKEEEENEGMGPKFKRFPFWETIFYANGLSH